MVPRTSGVIQALAHLVDSHKLVKGRPVSGAPARGGDALTASLVALSLLSEGDRPSTEALIDGGAPERLLRVLKSGEKCGGSERCWFRKYKVWHQKVQGNYFQLSGILSGYYLLSSPPDSPGWVAASTQLLYTLSKGGGDRAGSRRDVVEIVERNAAWMVQLGLGLLEVMACHGIV